MSKTVVMTGGGTGGHLAIIKAVKEKLKDEELIYIGSTSGQDRVWFGDDSDFSNRYFLETKGVANRAFIQKIGSLANIAKATKRAYTILKKHRADVVFSVGGYSAAAAAFASKLLGVSLVIHEQNAVPGSLNKILKPYSCKFISSFSKESFPYPIEQIFFNKSRVRKEVKTIIFLGGSQGAVAINNLALSMAKELQKRGIKIIHQAGERNIKKVKEDYQKLEVEAEVFGFSKNLPEYMQMADFAIARAGASTLWELSANGVPTLFIPYPYAHKDHQYYNAKFLADKNLAWVLRQDEIRKDEIFEILNSNIEKASKGLIDFTPKDGSKKIAEAILECARG